MRVHTVFSIENAPYQRWQAELLAFSHARAGQEGPLTCLVSGRHDLRPVLPRTFFTDSFCPHPRTRDGYSAYNKPAALGAWIREEPPDEEAVLIVDPDCVFLHPVDARVERGRPIATPIFYMDFRCGRNPVTPPCAREPSAVMDWPVFHKLVARHCAQPERVQGVGIPTLIHRDDLEAIAPAWLRKTEEIREDRELRDGVGWIAEMWGYCIAAAEAGLEHELRDLGCFATEDRDDVPLVHYCYDARHPSGSWTWAKRAYRPWARVPDPPPGTPRAGVALARALNELVAMRAAWSFGGEPIAREVAAAPPPLAAGRRPNPAMTPPWRNGSPEPIKRLKRPWLTE